jgi:putative transposase
MKKSRHSEEAIVAILREGAGDISAKALCARHNISEQTLYNWRRKYGGIEISGVRKIRSITEENGRLKRIIADLVVQNDILKVVNAKKW